MGPAVNISDKDLISLLNSGSKEAFTQIYLKYWDRLLSIAYNHTRDRSDAEEIVQNLFVTLWHRKNELTINNLEHYLATAIKFSIFKHHYRTQKIKENFFKKLTFQEEHTIDDQIAAKFLQEHINGIVSQLPEKCRLVFKLSREQQYSHAEIAEELNISEKTVEAHISKALRVIRKDLQSSGLLVLIASMAKYL